MLRSVVVHDPTDARLATGDVFFAIGVESPTVAVHFACRAHAVTVLIRGAAALDEEAAATAEGCGVAVVLVDPAVSWSHLCGLVYGLVLEGRETESRGADRPICSRSPTPSRRRSGGRW